MYIAAIVSKGKGNHHTGRYFGPFVDEGSANQFNDNANKKLKKYSQFFCTLIPMEEPNKFEEYYNSPVPNV